MKSHVSDEELDVLRKELTVSPCLNADYAALAAPKSYKLYMEGQTKMYMPKHYGIKRFGVPDVNRVPHGKEVELAFEGSLRPEQQAAVQAFLQAVRDPSKEGGLLNLTCASGKCLGKDTPVMMFNGKIKPVQDVCVGELLMGDDARPRRVTSVCQGYDTLYEVSQAHGNAYIVNKDHILSLKTDFGRGKVVDICIHDYMNLDASYRATLYGFKAQVSFPAQTKASGFLDPFVAGMLCIDSHCSAVPYYFKASNKTTMTRFLDGCLYRCGRHISATCSEYVVKHKQVSKDIEFMATCLGIASTVRRDSCGRWIVTTFSDDESIRQHFAYPINVKHKDKGLYYGFEINGNNRRFLLGDCTVTHNTVMAIYLMCQLKTKSLVIVHKDFLLEQWKERIMQFCPLARIGLIKASTVDVKDKDIVIGSLQSLSMKEYGADVFQDFGFVVVDEVHHTSAEVFCRALKKVSFKHTLGLSATIQRKDGLSKVFKWYLGDILYSNVKSTTSDVVHVKCLQFYSDDLDYCEEVFIKRQVLNIAQMVNNICGFLPRTQAIVQAIADALSSEPDRRIIVLSDRKAHLQHIGGLLHEKYDIHCGYYFGGMKQSELKESESKKIILGTFQMVSEGFDCKFLDTLVLASPKADVVQSVGRILREEVSKRKHVPLVIDIMDQFSMFDRQNDKRLAYYKKQKYNITDMQGHTLAQLTNNMNGRVVKLSGFAFRMMDDEDTTCSSKN